MSKRSALVAFVTLATLVISCMTATVVFPGKRFPGKMARKRRQLVPKQNFDVSELSQGEKDVLVNLHNMYRSAVNPPATAMAEVRWDDNIAEFSQTWAEQCIPRHRTNRIFSSFKNMGESIFFLKGDYYNLKSPVENWYNQSKDYTFKDNSCKRDNKDGENCDHYAVLMKASVTKIGCGMQYCKAGTEIKEDGYFFVCNYNVEYDPLTHLYEAGDPCSKCPANAPKCRYNLCVNEDMFLKCQGYNGSVKWTGVERGSTKSEAMDCPDFAPGNVAAKLSATDSGGPAKVTNDAGSDANKPAPQKSTAGDPKVGPQNDRDLSSEMLNVTVGRGTSDGVAVTAAFTPLTLASIVATTIFFTVSVIVLGV